MTRSQITRLSATPLANHRRGRRVAAERAGRLAEWFAVARLWCSGYRILARRCQTGRGEIDIVAVRGQRLAFVEVKHRAALGDAETSVRPRQMERLHAAADTWVAQHRRFAAHTRGFDAIFCAPGQWPRYARDHLQPQVRGRRR
jgi:putative endonuclease